MGWKASPRSLAPLLHASLHPPTLHPPHPEASQDVGAALAALAALGALLAQRAAVQQLVYRLVRPHHRLRWGGQGGQCGEGQARVGLELGALLRACLPAR